MKGRRRLDKELLRRELAESVELAQCLIAQKQVTVNGAIATKPAHQVLAGDAIELIAPAPKYVSRGGEKLQGALETFGLTSIQGLRGIDIGSSTGGFTDALLQAGARRVCAVDVGTAQLHEKIVNDERVDVFEQTDIRKADLKALGAPFDIVVIDVSFIGLNQIIEAVSESAAKNGKILALVKPQFEAEKTEVSKTRGVIADPEIWRRVLNEVAETFQGQGLNIAGVTASPITGGAGNVEFFFYAGATLSNVEDLEAEIDTAVELAKQLR